jgi:hypothetical protein
MIASPIVPVNGAGPLKQIIAGFAILTLLMIASKIAMMFGAEHPWMMNVGYVMEIIIMLSDIIVQI